MKEFLQLILGFILQWGSFIFFAACAILVNGLKIIWAAENMDILANSFFNRTGLDFNRAEKTLHAAICQTRFAERSLE